MSDQVLAAADDLRDVGDQDIAGQLGAGSLILQNGTVQILVALGGSIVAAAVPVGEFLLGVEVQASVGACAVQALGNQLEHIIIAGSADVDLAGSCAVGDLAGGSGVMVQVDHRAIGGDAGNLKVAISGGSEGVLQLLQRTHAAGVVRAGADAADNSLRQLHGGDGFIQLGQVCILQSAGNHIVLSLLRLDGHVHQIASDGDGVLGTADDDGGGTGVDAGEGDFGGCAVFRQADGGNGSIQCAGICICEDTVALIDGNGLADGNGEADLVRFTNSDHVDGGTDLDLGVAGTNAGKVQTGLANNGTAQDLGDLAVAVSGGGIGIQGVQIAVGTRADNQILAVGQVSDVGNTLVAGQFCTACARNRTVQHQRDVGLPGGVGAGGRDTVPLQGAAVEVQVAGGLVGIVAVIGHDAERAFLVALENGQVCVCICGVGVAGTSGMAGIQVNFITLCIRRNCAPAISTLVIGEGVDAGGSVDDVAVVIGVGAKLGSIGNFLAAAQDHGGNGGVQLGQVSIGIVAGLVHHGLGVAGQQLHLIEAQTDVLTAGGQVSHFEGGEGQGGAIGLPQQGDVAIGHLSQAGVSVEVGGDVVSVGQLHGVVLVYQEGVDVTVDTAAGSGACNQDHILAVDLLGILDGGQLAAGVNDGSGVDLGGCTDVVALCLGPDIVGVAQSGGAVTVEHTDSAVIQHDGGGLGAPGVDGCILAAGPVALGVHPDQAGTLVAAGVLVSGEDHVIIDFAVGTVAGAHQQRLLAGFLQVQKLRLGPVQTIGGGGHIQVVGGIRLVGRVGEEQVGVNALTLDVEVSINGVAFHQSIFLTLCAVGVDLQGVQIQVVAVGGSCGHGVVAAAADGDGVQRHVTQLQVVIVIEAGLAGDGRILGGIQSDAGGPQVGDQIGGGAIGADTGIDDTGGQVVVGVAVVAQVVGKGVGPVGTVVRGDGNDGIQTGTVAGMVPAGVAGCDEGSVIQGDDTGDTEILAAAGVGRKGLALSITVGRLLADLHCTDAHSHQAEEHTGNQQKRNGFLKLTHVFSSFLFLGVTGVLTICKSVSL